MNSYLPINPQQETTTFKNATDSAVMELSNL